MQSRAEFFQTCQISVRKGLSQPEFIARICHYIILQTECRMEMNTGDYISLFHSVCTRSESRRPAILLLYSSIGTAPPVGAVPPLLSNGLQQPHYPQHHGCAVLTQWLMTDRSPFALTTPPLSGCGDVSAR